MSTSLVGDTRIPISEIPGEYPNVIAHMIRQLPRLCLVAAAALAFSACHNVAPRPMEGSVERLDPALDALVSSTAQLERLAGGFAWSEGPAWSKKGRYLLFTDIPHNAIMKWQDSTGLSVYLRPAGFTGPNPPGRELGSNGLAFSANGTLYMADHGNRGIARLDDSIFVKTVIADRYNGKRFNSPNDLTFRSNGDVYFTDPPYGLKGQDADPAKELKENGVYRVTPSGQITLLASDVARPNGIAFSPDEKTLYVANSESTRAIWMAYDVRDDGTLARGRVFFDATPLARPGAPGLPDGLRVDRAGNLFATGPGGVLVFSPSGRHLGTIHTGQPTANVAFGDDGSTLYVTANDRLLRIRTMTKGAGF